MKFRTVVASLAVAISGSAAAVTTDLGVLDFGGSSFGKAFVRIFDFGSPLGGFVDHYTFKLLGASGAEGGTTVAMEWGSLDLDLMSVSLSGGTLDRTLSDDSPASFSFSGLGAGTYTFDVIGNLKSISGPLGFASYTGNIRSIASPAPEPGALALALAGLIGVGLLTRRGKRS
jgi:hypothetical protein